MDPHNYGHVYHYAYQPMNPVSGMPAPAAHSTPMGPPMHPQSHQQQTILYTGSEGDLSMNDSGYYSSTPNRRFTGLLSQPRGSSVQQLNQSQSTVSAHSSAYVQTPSEVPGPSFSFSPTKILGPTSFSDSPSKLLGPIFSHSPSKMLGPTFSHSPSKFLPAGYGHNSHHAGTSVAQQGTSYRLSPGRGQGQSGVGVVLQAANSILSPGRAVGDLLAVSQAGLPGDMSFSDEWEGNFINSFQENLFDSDEFTTIMDSIMTSPMSSPFKGLQGGLLQGLGVSPKKPVMGANVMLSGVKRSPVRAGGSPFHNLFTSPSPLKSFCSNTRTSPITRQRQRRLVLPSPNAKATNLAVHFADMPEFLSNIPEEDDDLGVVPFQRSNSMGFVPQDDTSSSSYASYHGEGSMQSACSYGVGQPLQEINPQQFDQPLFSPSKYNLAASPQRNFELQNSPPKTSSPARQTQGKITTSKHIQAMKLLPPKDALRYVRAHFRKVLDKATADAVVEETKRNKRLKAGGEKPKQFPEIAQALARPVPGTSQADYRQTSAAHRTATKRRQDILPKPFDWSNKEPCKIAPKKRKR